MSSDGGGEKPSGESDADSARSDRAVARLPSNATEPEAQPSAAGEQRAPKPSDRLPPAGPHADPALINQDATPGTGVLQQPGGHDDVDSTSG